MIGNPSLPCRARRRTRHLLDLCKSALEISRKAIPETEGAPSVPGVGPSWEFYRDKFPELASDPDALIALIRSEFDQRGGRRREGLFHELLGRFPTTAEGLRKALAWPDIPGYHVLGELGRGGMGVVYKAKNLQLDRDVARR